MPELQLPSGAVAEINDAGFLDTMKLKAAISKEIAKSGVKIELDLKKDIDPAMLINAFLAVDSSPDVMAALWPCLARSKYNGEKIIPASFESTAARQDYYPIVVECVKVNIGPFFPGLISLLKPFKIPGMSESAPK